MAHPQPQTRHERVAALFSSTWADSVRTSRRADQVSVRTSRLRNPWSFTPLLSIDQGAKDARPSIGRRRGEAAQ